MRALFWLSLGATLAALITRKLSRAAAKLTPSGLAKSLSDGLSELAGAVGSFAADVRSAMAVREQELRAAAGLDVSGSDANGSDANGSGANGSGANGSGASTHAAG